MKACKVQFGMKNLRGAGPLACWTFTIPLLAASSTLTAQQAGLTGVWRGESICMQQGTACKNEHVLYYVDAIPDHPDQVQIRADKIVNGEAITMGTSAWHVDADRHTVEWKTPRQVWLFSFSGTHMEGTLKLSDGTVVRKASLQKQ
jgi:hypothetical protein